MFKRRGGIVFFQALGFSGSLSCKKLSMAEAIGAFAASSVFFVSAIVTYL